MTQNRLLKRLSVCLLAVATLTCAKAQTEQSIYVSPKGNDRADGSLSHPLRSIQAAIEKANRTGKNIPVAIILRAGRYEQEQTIEIKDRGNLTIRPYEQEVVSIAGGRQIPAGKMQKVKDTSVAARIRPEVRKQIRELDLKKLNVTCGNLRNSGFGRPSLPAWTQVFMDEVPFRIARWPNDSTQAIGEIVEPGATADGKPGALPVFGYEGNRPTDWKDVSQMWIGGYFAHGYVDDMIKVACIDTIRRHIHAAQHTVYGFMTGAPWRQWFAMNLVEELDQPGEYVIDSLRQKIYLYPPQTKGTDLHVTSLEGPILAIEHVSDVHIQNLTFEYGRSIGIYLEETEQVRIEGCTIRNLGGTGIVIGKGYLSNPVESYAHESTQKGQPASRVIGHLQGKMYEDVLYDRKGGKNNGIIDCHIYNVGSGGVSMGGGNRASLTPAGNFVENCLIHDFNLIEKSYKPGIWIDGVGNRISQCDIFNAPSMAILLHGNDHIIELCRINNVCTEVDDQGAIYHGRDPSEQGNIIRYCYFKELSPRHRVTATYHDDGACGTTVYGNIYYKAGSLPALIGGGHHIHYLYNIFMECPTAIHIDNRMENWGKGMVAPNGIIDQRLKQVNYQEPPYSTAYPELAKYWDENPAYPSHNVVEGNLFYRIGNVLHGRSEWSEFYNNWTTNDDPGFVCPEDPLQGFKADAALFQKIKGFPDIPFSKIGYQETTHSSNSKEKIK